LKIVGDFLEVQNSPDLPPVPRTHAAKNIGTEIYHAILFETKPKQQMDQSKTQEQREGASCDQYEVFEN